MFWEARNISDKHKQPEMFLQKCSLILETGELLYNKKKEKKAIYKISEQYILNVVIYVISGYTTCHCHKAHLHVSD